MMLPNFFEEDKSDERYIFIQFSLVTILVGFLVMLIWGLAPLRDHNNKMKNKMEQHRIHDKHHYNN